MVRQIKIDKDSTTSSTINILLDEKCHHAASNVNDQQRQESAMAALDCNAKSHGKLYCHNCCKETNHVADDCWAPGGGKEGQGPKKKRSNRGTTSKHKGKERARHAIDDVSSVEEDSNVIMFKKAFNTSSSNYDASEHIENQARKDQTYSTCTAGRSAIIIDSGTSSHIHSNQSDFKSLSSSSGNINGFGDGKRRIEGRGEFQVTAKLLKKGCAHLKLKDTCFVSDSHPSLISVSRLDDAKCYTLFGNGKCVTFEKNDHGKLMQDALAKENVMFTTTKQSDHLYYLDVPGSFTDASYNTTTFPKLTKLQSLHEMLGHLGHHIIKGMVKKRNVLGICLSTKELSEDPGICAVCAQGNSKHASFPPRGSDLAKDILDLVHSDLWGPAPIQSLHGYRYLYTFTDDAKHWVWVYFLWRKSEAFEVFKDWLVEQERATGRKLKKYQVNNGGEFITNEWKKFMREHGIHFQTSSPNTPEQNGIAESLNRVIFDRVCAILIDSGLPMFLWLHAVLYIIWNKNRNPSSALHGVIPYEAHYGKPPDLKNVHHFGARAFLHIDKSHRNNKLAPRATECIFVGYSETQKAFKVYLLRNINSKTQCMSRWMIQLLGPVIRLRERISLQPIILLSNLKWMKMKMKTVLHLLLSPPTNL